MNSVVEILNETVDIRQMLGDTKLASSFLFINLFTCCNNINLPESRMVKMKLSLLN